MGNNKESKTFDHNSQLFLALVKVEVWQSMIAHFRNILRFGALNVRLESPSQVDNCTSNAQFNLVPEILGTALLQVFKVP
jgi:hypothetical protein